MDISQALGFSLVGLAAGTLSGMLGIGGAVLIIPALIYLFGFDQRTAQGTSLLLMLPPIGILAVHAYWKSGHIRILPAVFIAAFFILGGLVGSRISLKMDLHVLRRVFAVFLGVIAVRMFFKS